jgi:hypothetical protein
MGITPIILILGILLVAAAILVGASASEGEKQHIRQYLVEQRATEIFISKAPTTGDGGTNTYDVAFTDAQGEEQRTRCTLRRGLRAGKEIEWQDPI